MENEIVARLRFPSIRIKKVFQFEIVEFPFYFNEIIRKMVYVNQCAGTKREESSGEIFCYYIKKDRYGSGYKAMLIKPHDYISQPDMML